MELNGITNVDTQAHTLTYELKPVTGTKWIGANSSMPMNVFTRDWHDVELVSWFLLHRSECIRDVPPVLRLSSAPFSVATRTTAPAVWMAEYSRARTNPRSPSMKRYVPSAFSIMRHLTQVVRRQQTCEQWAKVNGSEHTASPGDIQSGESDGDEPKGKKPKLTHHGK